jgi:hypothetical protein
MILTGETEGLGEKPVAAPLCATQIGHGLIRERTRFLRAEKPAPIRLSYGRALKIAFTHVRQLNLIHRFRVVKNSTSAANRLRNFR